MSHLKTQQYDLEQNKGSFVDQACQRPVVGCASLLKQYSVRLSDLFLLVNLVMISSMFFFSSVSAKTFTSTIIPTQNTHSNLELDLFTQGEVRNQEKDTLILTRARPGLTARWLRNKTQFIQTKLSADFVGSPRLLDAELEYALSSHYSLFIGQHRPFLGHHGRIGISELSFADRDQVTRHFYPGRRSDFSSGSPRSSNTLYFWYL